MSHTRVWHNLMGWADSQDEFSLGKHGTAKALSPTGE